MKPIHRRTVLRSAAGLAVGLPFLEALAPRGAGAAMPAPPKRFFVWYTPVGTVLSAWRPGGATGTNWTASRILEPLDVPVLRERMTILSNLHGPAAEELAGNGHAKGMTHVLTARPYVDVTGTQFGNEGWGGGISIDQFLAEKMATTGRLSSIEAGVVSFYPGSASRYMSYSGPGQANIVPIESDPRKLFARLFSTDGGMDNTVDEMDRLALQRKSVFDTVLDDFNRLNGKLGGADKIRLDKHATLVRELEQRIQVSDGTNPNCQTPTLADYTDDEVRDNANLPELGKLTMDLLVAGLACDTTRVASLVWSPGESFYNFTEILPNAPWGDLSCPPNVDTCTDGKNLPATFLHVMSHFPPSTANGVPGNMNTVQTAALECLTQVEVWFSEQLAYFAQQLAGITESDGSSILDNTVLLSIKDISEGVTHSYRDVPAVLLGGKNLFQPGHFNLRNEKTFGDLFATIGQSLGFEEVTSFGDEQYFTGTIDDIRV